MTAQQVILEEILSELREIRKELVHLKHNQEQIMSALDDLKAAMSNLVNEAITDLEAVIAKIQPGTSDVDLQALTQQANDATAKLKADMAAIVAAPAATTTAPSGTDPNATPPSA